MSGLKMETKQNLKIRLNVFKIQTPRFGKEKIYIDRNRYTILKGD